MGYYVPLKNDDGTIIGIIFSGRESGDVSRQINKIIGLLSIITLVIVVIIAIAGFYLANKISSDRNLQYIVFFIASIWLLYTNRETPYKFFWQ